MANRNHRSRQLPLVASVSNISFVFALFTSFLSPVLAAENLQMSPLEADRRMIAELPPNPGARKILVERLHDVVFEGADTSRMDDLRIARAQVLAYGILHREFNLPEHQRQNSSI
jgi:hypothetical protein